MSAERKKPILPTKKVPVVEKKEENN